MPCGARLRPGSRLVPSRYADAHRLASNDRTLDTSLRPRRTPPGIGDTALAPATASATPDPSSASTSSGSATAHYREGRALPRRGRGRHPVEPRSPRKGPSNLDLLRLFAVAPRLRRVQRSPRPPGARPSRPACRRDRRSAVEPLSPEITAGFGVDELHDVTRMRFRRAGRCPQAYDVQLAPVRFRSTALPLR